MEVLVEPLEARQPIQGRSEPKTFPWPHPYRSPDPATERFRNGNHRLALSAPPHRRALAATQSRPVASQMAAGDPTLHRPLVPLDRVPCGERRGVLRDPLHRALPERVV